MISEEGENTMAKTKVICFTNNKGGSGKTTTCSNVGFGLRELGKKVLMIESLPFFVCRRYSACICTE